MTEEDYEKIKDWPLRSHLIEIQDYAESARLRIKSVMEGYTINTEKDLLSAREMMNKVVDWIGHVQRHHAPDPQPKGN